MIFCNKRTTQQNHRAYYKSLKNSQTWASINKLIWWHKNKCKDFIDKWEVNRLEIVLKNPPRNILSKTELTEHQRLIMISKVSYLLCSLCEHSQKSDV